MNENIIEKNIVKISFFVIGLIIAGIISSFFEVFQIFAQWIAPIIIGIFILFLIWYHFKRYRKKSNNKVIKFEVALILLLLIFSIVNGLFYYENLGATRDYGGYVANAVILSHEGKINLDPSFSYSGSIKSTFSNQLVLSRIIGYPVYLALFYTWGGLLGLFLANSLLLFLSLCIFYFLGKSIKNKWAGILFVLFFASHYLTIYFSRQTLSENIMLFLFWFGIYLLIKGYYNKNLSFVLSSLIPILVTLFVRVEGIFHLFTFLIVIIIINNYQKNKWPNQKINKNILLVILFLICIFIGYIVFFLPPSYAQIMHVARFVVRPLVVFSTKIIPTMADNVFIQENFISTSTYRIKEVDKLGDINYVFSILFFYLILPYIILSLIGLYKRQYKFIIFLITIIVLPSFLYLYDPLIARDQPWALRRYWAIFIPYVMLLASIVIVDIKRIEFQALKKFNKINIIPISLVIIILLLNIIFLSKIFFYSENRNQGKQLSNIANKFTPNDIVIMPTNYYDTIGRFTAILKYHYGLDGIIWPAYHQEKTPYIDISAIKEYINKSSNKNIYVISSVDNDSEDNINYLFNNDNLNKIDDFSLNFTRLLVTYDDTQFPPAIPKINELKYFIYEFQ
ncbi:hypothetical protein KKC06_00105 [Patescibacteria group bacterium]|nr:hypothetical protein [Patescibacteria group bacterium]